jgi:uncharacterized repeat protein (TIGR03803 family)
MKTSIILAVIFAVAARVEAQDYIYTINNGTISITGYTGSGGRVTIPTTINGLPVTSIGHNGFFESYGLSSVAIPNTVISIGDGAFSDCTNLTAVTTGNSVTTIGTNAFFNCPRLTSFAIPTSVTTIGDGAFSGCTGLTTITIPSNIASIGNGMFSGCTGLTNATIGNGVTSIGTNAFTSCTSLTSINIPNAVTNIGGSAFFYCIGLTNLTIGNSVGSIGSYACSYCTGLNSVTIPSSVTNMGSYSFSDCTNLKAVVCQGNAPDADSSVFNNDNSATVYYLPATIGWGTNFGGRPTGVFWNSNFQPILFAFGENSDGASPLGGLVLSGNTLYGSTPSGGIWDNGTVFRINTDGAGFMNLHSFAITPAYPKPQINVDGANPSSGLILSGRTLYGTAPSGGVWGNGTVFAVNTDGTGFTNLHSFTAGSGSYPNLTNNDGAWPQTELVMSGTTIYGSTESGGIWGNGTVFAINSDGTGFTNLHNFAAGSGNIASLTNSDGANPYGILRLSGNTLYGTAPSGGNWGSGTVFAVNIDGTGFKTLHHFTATTSGTNIDGKFPYGVFLSENTLYGTTSNGGNSGKGVLFRMNTDGEGFMTLHVFQGTDGVFPNDLILLGTTIYGTTSGGGNSGNGTVFAVSTNGTGFTVLHSFRNSHPTYPSYTNIDGASPFGELVLSGNALYGTTSGGGSGGGTLYKLFIPPQLTIVAAGPNLIFTWLTNANGFTLQSTTSLDTPTVWTTNSPAPVVVNGQYAVTNPITGKQQFFRLSQ